MPFLLLLSIKNKKTGGKMIKLILKNKLFRIIALFILGLILLIKPRLLIV